MVQILDDVARQGCSS